MSIKALLLIAFWPLATAWADAGDGLKIAVAGDIAGEFSVAGGTNANNRLDPRGVEFLFYAPVDHLFEARASLAAHIDTTSPTIALHEAYIGSSKLIPRSRFRVGQFFLGVGRLNRFHAHDWPFISAPKVHREIFDGRNSIQAEGALDTGVEYSWLFPMDHFLELTVGLTNGWAFGHTHILGAPPQTPTHYTRLATYWDLPGKGGVQTALNYLGRTHSGGTVTSIFGLDLTAKWRRGKVLAFLLQSEMWLSTATPNGGATTQKFGFYVYPQMHMGKNWYLGTRFDLYTVPTASFSNYDLNIVPTVSFQPSHFSTFRLAYNIKPSYRSDTGSSLDHFFELQSIFILGAHPAHSF